MLTLINKIVCLSAVFLYLPASLAQQNEFLSEEQILKQLSPTKDLSVELSTEGQQASEHCQYQGCAAAEPASVNVSDSVATAVPTRASVNLSAITFEYNSAVLTAQAKRQLYELGRALSSNTLADSTFELIGHTDAAGSNTYNLTLSNQRAMAVFDYLTSQFRISPKRMTTYGLGESRPAIPSDPFAKQNRRVEIIASE